MRSGMSISPISPTVTSKPRLASSARSPTSTAPSPHASTPPSQRTANEGRRARPIRLGGRAEDAMTAKTYALTGRPVHRVGFGAMQLPGPGVFGPPRDRDQALAVLRRGVELGVNHLDTAQFYGPGVANELIRQALHPYPDDLVLVSKVGAARDGDGAW